MGSLINFERKVIYTDRRGNPHPLDYEHLDVWVVVDKLSPKIYFRTEDGRWDKMLND